MQNDTTIVVGDKIDLTVDGKQFYLARVDDIDRNGLVMISAPIYRQTQMHLRLYDEVYVVFYRISGRYIVLARVVDIVTKNETQYPVIEILTDPEKDQRREYYRLPVNSIDTVLFEYTEGAELTLALREDIEEAARLADARAKDISVAGIGLLTTKWECKRDERYMLKLYFDGFKGDSAPFLVCGRVVRSVLTPESGIYNVGMQLFGLTKSKNDFLTKYILTEQQKRIVQEKLIVGEE
ncbi:MAG: flagellar brake protein [Oscillospiraceae bacterium]|nr:flagellar brake protein [Oscillospiraceae bacterium]